MECIIMYIKRIREREEEDKWCYEHIYTFIYNYIYLYTFIHNYTIMYKCV